MVKLVNIMSWFKQKYVKNCVNSIFKIIWFYYIDKCLIHEFYRWQSENALCQVWAIATKFENLTC